MPEILLPLEISQQAFGDPFIKAFASEISRDKSQVYRWLGDPDLDPYTRFIAVLQATDKVNPPGADLFIEDATARLEAWRSGELIKGASRDAVIADALEVLQAFARDEKEFEAKATTLIRMLRFLITQKRADAG